MNMKAREKNSRNQSRRSNQDEIKEEGTESKETIKETIVTPGLEKQGKN